MDLKDIAGKRVLVLGFGKEGRDTLRFLRNEFKDIDVAVADSRNRESFSSEELQELSDCKTHLGEDYLRYASEYEVIIRSPGIHPAFVQTEGVVTSQTEIFFDNCTGTIIGVTGTKGKGTTASLITDVLRAGGVTTHLVGNIGNPSLGSLKEKGVFVYELSSFQLMGLKRSPHIAVFLNLHPEHLDYHSSYEEYRDAKLNLVRHQTEDDHLIYEARLYHIMRTYPSQKISFDMSEPMLIEPLPFVSSPDPAIIVGRMFDIEDRTIFDAIRSFKPLEHRLEPVGKYKEISFIDDSMGTTSPATIEAIRTLGDNLDTIILGGSSKGESEYKELGEAVKNSKIRNVILLPDTGKDIWEYIQGSPQRLDAADMDEAVRLAYQYTEQGRVCLMSPAAASFNMFKDYKERGDKFKESVIKHGS